MDLISVAHVHASDDFDLVVSKSRSLEVDAGTVCQNRKIFVHPREVDGNDEMVGFAVFVDDIRADETRGPMNGCSQWNDNLLDSEMSGIPAGVDWRCPAVGEKCEMPRIVASLHCGFADQIAHMCGGDTMDTVCCRSLVDSQRLGNLSSDSCERCLLIEAHSAAEEIILVQISKDDIGVRDRWLGAAETVAHRARLRPGASRPDF